MSLDFVKYFDIPETAKIIDVGGESLFVNHLLAMGYEDIIVLDVSEAELQRAMPRLLVRCKTLYLRFQENIS